MTAHKTIVHDLLVPQDVVDRKLMTNLIVQYHQKKFSPEVLELLGRVLGFSEDEKNKVGLRRRGLLGLLTPLAPPISAEEQPNLVELWVSFLEKETDTPGGP